MSDTGKIGEENPNPTRKQSPQLHLYEGLLETSQNTFAKKAFYFPAFYTVAQVKKPGYKKRAKGLGKKEKWEVVPKLRVYDPNKKNTVPLRTQKARGVVAATSLSQYSAIPRWLAIAPIQSVLPQCYGDMSTYNYPLFARPCPRRPRHGFVESRIVNNREELLGVVAETMAADRLGEVMLMAPLTGRASAVVTDSGVVWGMGNAGVTGGKGKQVMLPVPPKKQDQGITDHLKRAHRNFGAEMHGSVYIEVVEDDGNPTIVQMRDGPAEVAIGGNYVPEKDYIVQNVIVPTFEEQENLLLWEKRVAGAPKGTAIVIRNSSLTSHCAVHGLANKFAVLTEGPFADAPETLAIGTILQPADNQPPPLTKADYAAIAKYMRKTIPQDRASRAAFAVSVLHAMSVWGNDPALLWLRAAGVMTMAKLVVSACAGEARHFYRCGPGRYTEGAAPTIPWKMITGRELGMSNYPERSVVLQSVYRYSIKRLALIAENCVEDFRGNWNGRRLDRHGRQQGSCGYGGPKWRDSSKAARKLCTAIIKFKKRPCERTWAEVSMCYNMAVCLAHNGGRVLNKWAGASEIDQCARFPQLGLMSPQAMFICTGVKGDDESGKPGKKKKKKKVPSCGDSSCAICPLVRVKELH